MGRNADRRVPAVAVVIVSVVVLLLMSVGPALAARTAAVYGRDVYESDDTIATAKRLPGYSSHTFHTTGDVDWFRITSEASGTRFVIQTQGISGQSINTSLSVYAWPSRTGTPAQLAFNDDSFNAGKAWSSSLLFVAPGPGDYYCAVSGGSGVADSTAGAAAATGASSTGHYVLYCYKGMARRVAGADRFSTAVAVSRTMWPDADNPGWAVAYDWPQGPDFVVLANPEYPSDVLAGASLAGRYGAPLLLTAATYLPNAVRNEIVRLGESHYLWQRPFPVVFMGGTKAISTAVRNQVISLEPVTSYHRITGANRYEIASRAATYAPEIPFRFPLPPGGASAGVKPQLFLPPVDTVYVANGYATADQVVAGALSSGGGRVSSASEAAPSSIRGGALLYTTSTGLPAPTRDALRQLAPYQVVVLGGTASISDVTFNAIKGVVGPSVEVTRVSAPNRYALAAKAGAWAIANRRASFDGGVVLVSGSNLIDALSAGPLAGYTAGPVLFAKYTGLPYETRLFLDRYGPRTVPSYCVGGTATVPDSVFRAFTLHREPTLR